MNLNYYKCLYNKQKEITDAVSKKLNKQNKKYKKIIIKQDNMYFKHINSFIKYLLTKFKYKLNLRNIGCNLYTKTSIKVNCNCDYFKAIKGALSPLKKQKYLAGKAEEQDMECIGKLIKNCFIFSFPMYKEVQNHYSLAPLRRLFGIVIFEKKKLD